MNLKCELKGHKYIAVNPKTNENLTQYQAACQRVGCGSPAILTVWGNPASEIILYEPKERWRGKGKIPAWAKIVVS